MIRTTSALLLLTATATTTSIAYAQATLEPSAHVSTRALETTQALELWRGEHGARWKTITSRGTGRPDLLYGGTADPLATPVTDAAFEVVAREFLIQTHGIHGIEPNTLSIDRTILLPLGQAGSTDKMSVRFRQSVAGVPVSAGYVNVLMDMGGRLLSIQAMALPDLGRFNSTPETTTAGAFAAIEAAFDTDFGLTPTSISTPVLMVVPLSVDERVLPVLAYESTALWESAGFTPEGTVYWVDAHTGAIRHRAPAIHNFDVTGTAYTMATPGTYPDSGSNPETQQPMPYARVESSSGTVYTDANGDFTISGTNGPLNVTVSYLGTFCNTNTDSGSDHSVTANISGTGNSVLLNSSSQALVTAQANSYQSVNLLRDWIRAIVPTDGTADFSVTSNCNINDNCNAYFNGASINFYTAGGGCVNTSYSTVVAHEEGHWLNVRYGTGNGGDGMGEGNADVFGMYLYDFAIVGPDFCGSGCNVRNGNNMRQYCGDGNGGCYGGVHADGEVWMGAAWKVRSNLKASNGDASGSLIADTLFLGWMNAYNQNSIHSIIETQWLTLDDTDGNIDNGTPHYTDINAGFLQQGFPGYDLDLIGISNVTDVADTESELLPYPVDATIQAYVASAIANATVRYRVNGTAWQSAAMTQTSGDQWSSDIPPQASPAVVEYYVQASDTIGNSATSPADAPGSSYSFAVGVVAELLVDDFESDMGWTVGAGDTASTGTWERGDPIGTDAQPNQDHTQVGQQCFFTGQGSVGGSLGENDVDGGITNLVSPAIDLSNHPLATLSYWLWYSNDTGAEPNADIFEVQLSGNNGTSWTTAETVGPTGDETNGGWYYHELSVHSYITPGAQTRIRFRASDLGGGSLVEAAVDDLRLIGIGSGDGCAQPISYGEGKVNSAGAAPLMGSFGTPSATTNDLVINVDLGIANQPAILFHGPAADNTPFFGGTRLVSPPISRAGVRVLDFIGSANWDYPVAAGAVGTSRFFQVWMRDPAHSDGTGVGMSNGLQISFCE